jgi:uracil-DNA glycosylase
MNRDFAEHLDMLFSCRACPNVLGAPVTGFVENARVMLIGQAPGPREMKEGRPFAYTAGKRLFSWFAPFITEEEFRARVYVGAVIRCFPGRDPKAGGDRVPDALEIANCARHLDREIALLRPTLIIAVGTLASKQLVGIAELKDAVGRVHRISRGGHELEVIVLPHPSGRSTWTNKAANAALLVKALRLIEKRMESAGLPPAVPAASRAAVPGGRGKHSE